MKTKQLIKTIAKKKAIEQYIKIAKRVTLKDLANIFSVSTQAMQQFLKYHGIKKENAYEKYSAQDIADYYKKNPSIQKVADYFKTDRTTIKAYLKKLGIKHKRKTGHRIMKSDLIAFIEKEGNPTFRRIGEHFGETTRYAQFCVNSYCINKKVSTNERTP